MKEKKKHGNQIKSAVWEVSFSNTPHQVEAKMSRMHNLHMVE